MTAFIAVTLFEKLEMGILRRARINLDVIWTAASSRPAWTRSRSSEYALQG